MARKNKGYSERRKPYDVYMDYIRKFEKAGRYLEDVLTEKEFEAEYASQKKKNALAKKKGQEDKVVKNIARTKAYDTLVVSKAELKELELFGKMTEKGIESYGKEDFEKWMKQMTWEDAKGEVHVATSKRQALYMNLRMLGVEEGSMGFLGENRAVY